MPQQPAPSDEIIPAAPASVIHELKYIDLLLLKTLAETESLTKTSARIGISVAKASRMLSSLRKLFNNELVQRCGPRMIATPTLERLLPDIRAALKVLENCSSIRSPFILQTLKAGSSSPARTTLIWRSSLRH